MIIKRIFDLLISILGLILLFPIMLIIAIIIRFKLGSPIFFIQERVGKDNKSFKMYKFRSMTNEKDENGNLLPNEIRLTSFGKLIRNLSIDELPELFNVVKGEMSLIGPRPLPIRYLSLYDENQIRRHNVLPGLSGWAQINGRNTISWEERFELDIWYVDNWSIFLDIKIFFLTIYKVLRRDGIDQNNSVGKEAFKNCNYKGELNK